MLRLTILLLTFCAPLAAVAPTGETALELESATLDVAISAEHETTVKTTLTVRNPGEPAELEFELADNLVPENQHKAFTLAVDGRPVAPTHSRKAFLWKLNVQQSMQLSWTSTSGSTALPHRHVLGLRALTVGLTGMRSYAALPAEISVNVSHELPVELFDQQAAGFSIQHPAGKRVQNFTLHWRESTFKDKRTKLDETLDSITEKQRNPDNRQYTTTLVQLVDVATLAADHQAIARHCEALAALETAGAITGCGPWAEWRRYVPWQLLRLRALEALGQETKTCAAECAVAMAERWPAYLKARKAARPFDEFEPRFGVYWDYDWDTTRALYARALEINGDAEAAKAVESE